MHAISELGGAAADLTLQGASASFLGSALGGAALPNGLGEGSFLDFGPDGLTFAAAHVRACGQSRAQPGARVLVHCKGGRGRASTMALAFQLAREMEAASPSSPRGRAAPRRLMAAMKEKRPVVETAVARYPAVATFRKLWAEERQRRRPGGASPGGGRLRTRRSHDNDGGDK